MLPKDLYSKIQKFHFRTRFLANDLFAGQYKSAFKGKGMEFVEVREYREGDDVRDIEWNVTARLGSPHVKVYAEERELTMFLALDVSASNLFGTRRRFKSEVMAEAAGLLSFVAIRSNDKVGAVLFGQHVESFIAPQKGAAHVWAVIKEIFAHPVSRGSTDLAAPLEYINRVSPRRAIVFFLSDFLVPVLDKRFKKAAAITSRRHDFTALRVRDPAEEALPGMGLAWMRDPESGLVAAIDTSSRALRRRWSAFIREQDKQLAALFAANRTDLVDLSTKGSVVEPLVRYFHAREARG